MTSSISVNIYQAQILKLKSQLFSFWKSSILSAENVIGQKPLLWRVIRNIEDVPR